MDFSADMEWDALEPNKDGALTARFLAELGKQDLMTVIGQMPESFVKEYPNAPIVVRAGVDGNINKVTSDRFCKHNWMELSGLRCKEKSQMYWIVCVVPVH